MAAGFSMQDKTSGAAPCISLTLTYVNFKSSRENHKHNKRAANSAGKVEQWSVVS